MKQKQKILISLLLVLVTLPAVSAVAFDLISATYSPAPASPGKLITLYATIRNTSSEDSGAITVTAKLDYPFSLSPSGKSEAPFSTVLGQQTALAVLEIPVDKAALNGNYPVEIRVKQEGRVVFGRLISIQVLAFKPQIEIIESKESEASPGQILQNTIIIRNVGSSTAKNIFIGTSDDRTVTTTGTVVDRPIKNLGASYIFLETLGPNETKEIPFTLGIDSTAEQKTHSVPIKIKFQDDNRSDYEVTRYIGIRVQGNASLDGSISPNSKSKAFPGGTADVSVNLFNRGSATARNIVVEVIDNPIWEIQSEKKVFIGTLDPDDFDSFNVTAKISPNTKPGSYPITLKFEYKNQDYQTKTEEKTVTLQVVSQQDAKTNGQQGSIFDWLLPLAIIAVIAYVGYRRFFGKRNNNAKK